MEVTVFKHAKSPQPWFHRNIMDCLEAIQYGKFIELTNTVKNAENKAEKQAAKAKLPAFTPSGTFKYRRYADLIKHSGLICMDIDDVQNMEETKRIINADEYTFASFESASGKGLAFLVKIDPERHLESFLAIEQYYLSKKISISADQSCKDVSRLRFFSTDFELYLFEKSFVWDLFPQKTKPKKIFAPAPPTRTQLYTYSNEQTSTAEQVEKLINVIEKKGIDITQDYKDWIGVGFALYAEFGEGGREYFHRISCLYADYDIDKADKVYESCRKLRTGTTIKLLFHIAKQHYGVSIYDQV